MKDAFLIAYERLIRPAEGGYVDDPADRGGETYHGIARRLHPTWEGWPQVDAAKRRAVDTGRDVLDLMAEVEPVLRPAVLAFYRREFWDRLLGDVLPPDLAAELMDTAVNSGVGAAVRDLQRALTLLNRAGALYEDLEADGVAGRKTLAAVDALLEADGRAEGGRRLRNLVNVLQGARYVEIGERDRSQRRFVRGWLDRVTVEERVDAS